LLAPSRSSAASARSRSIGYQIVDLPNGNYGNAYGWTFPSISGTTVIGVAEVFTHGTLGYLDYSDAGSCPYT
jgi:hypothetical protein